MATILPSYIITQISNSKLVKEILLLVNLHKVFKIVKEIHGWVIGYKQVLPTALQCIKN
jgi:hypothetical protein